MLGQHILSDIETMHIIIKLAVLLFIPDMLYVRDQPREITFSGGVRLDIDTPTIRIMVPLNAQAFKRMGIKFNSVHLPESSSPGISNSS